MSDDNEGIDQLAEQVTDEDLQELAGESPDDDSGSDSTTDQLMELGLDRETAEGLEDVEAEALVPILKERQKAFTKKTTELNARVNQLKEKAEQADLILGSEEFQEFVLSRGKEPEPKSDGPPEDGTDEEIFQWYVNQATKDQQEEIAELKQMVSQLLSLEGDRELQRYQEQYSDWEKYENEIGGYMRKGLSPDEAYRLAKANDTEMVSVEELRKRVKKRKSSNTLKGGKSGAIPKRIDPAKAKQMSEEEHFKAAAKRALAAIKDRSNP